MALIQADRTLETSTTTGTGSYTLAGAVVGFRAFSSVAANGDTVEAYVEEVDVNGVPSGGWETGTYTWGTGGILARTVISASSNGGAAVNWVAGTRRVGLGLTGARLAALTAGSIIIDKAGAYLNTAANTTAAGWQKVPIDTMAFDTNSLWDNTNKRVIPKKAGYYLVSLRVRTASAAALTTAVGFNGTQVQGVGPDNSSTNLASGGSTILFFNGTTDYAEAFAFASSIRAYTTGSFDTYLNVVGPL